MKASAFVGGNTVFPFTAIVYILSSCYPKSSLYLTSSLLPFLCFLPLLIPVFLFSSAVYFNKLLKDKIRMSHSVQCLWNRTARGATRKNFSICSNICFSLDVKLFSLQLPALFPPFRLFIFGQISVLFP